MLEVYPSLALEIWDRFDHVFIAELLEQTAKLKKSINEDTESSTKVEKPNSAEDFALHPDKINEFRALYKNKKLP